MHADPVAHVQILELRERILAQDVDAAEQLDVARRVAQLQKRKLSLIALGHDATGHVHLVLGGSAVFKVGVLLDKIGQMMRVLERVAVGVLARSDESRSLRAAHFNGVVFDDLVGGVAHLRFLYLSDRSSQW